MTRDEYIERARKPLTDDRKEFAELLSEGRRLAGMSLQAAAMRFRTSVGQVSRWENGHSAPPLVARQEIVDLLGRELSRLKIEGF